MKKCTNLREKVHVSPHFPSNQVRNLKSSLDGMLFCWIDFLFGVVDEALYLF